MHNISMTTFPAPSATLSTAPTAIPDPRVRREGNQWVLTLSQWLPVPPSQLFPFFADAYNLEQLTPPLLRFHVVTPRPIDMQTGTLIDYRLRVRGMPIRWRTRIATWDPPHGFTDEQLRGPYRKWHHTHTFTPSAAPLDEHGTMTDNRPGTRCEDRVEYRPPGGPLAPLINKLAVQRDVEAIFRYRAQVLAKTFGS